MIFISQKQRYKHSVFPALSWLNEKGLEMLSRLFCRVYYKVWFEHLAWVCIDTVAFYMVDELTEATVPVCTAGTLRPSFVKEA
jgi:hypothetical protein